MTHMPKPLTTAQDRLRETSPRSLLNLRMVGFALARAWVYLMFLGTATSSITWNGEPLPAGAYLGSTLVLCATLFASAIFHRRFATLSRSSRPEWGGFFFPFDLTWRCLIASIRRVDQALQQWGGRLVLLLVVRDASQNQIRDVRAVPR